MPNFAAYGWHTRFRLHGGEVDVALLFVHGESSFRLRLATCQLLQELRRSRRKSDTKRKHVPFCVSPRLVGGACIEHERKRAYGAPPQRVVLCETFLRFRWKRHQPQKRQVNCHNALRHYIYRVQKRKTDVNFFRMAQITFARRTPMPDVFLRFR